MTEELSVAELKENPTKPKILQQTPSTAKPNQICCDWLCRNMGD